MPGKNSILNTYTYPIYGRHDEVEFIFIELSSFESFLFLVFINIISIIKENITGAQERRDAAREREKENETNYVDLFYV